MLNSDIKGTLIPIGGNEDKGLESGKYNMDFIEEGILSHVVQQSGGRDSFFVIVPTASSIPDEVIRNYTHAFENLGCRNVHALDIRKREQADSEDILAMVQKADCVLFSGGDQSKIADIIGQTGMHQILLNRFHHEDFVIAGSSAGAMSMSREMITGGSSSEALIKGAVKMKPGMNFISNLVIDSHFIRRGRFGRLAEAVARYPNLLGVGLAEDTGLIIKKCNKFQVIGSGMVILFDARDLRHNNEAILDEGTPMSLSNLVVHILSNSDAFSVDDRKIEILPVEAPFI